MPKLQFLWIYSWPQLRSLRFLQRAAPRLAASLTELHIVKCSALPLDELEHVHSLYKQLVVLDLEDSFTAPMPANLRRLLTPPNCKLLPRLKSFVYSPPQTAAESAATAAQMNGANAAAAAVQ